ncbi:MAG: ATP-binding protein [Desulfobacteraceae bacterium]|nr:ATP-binding protein [Desulfobacteraceae bacterium]
MKIKTLYFKDVGPLKEQEIDLADSWTNDIARMILFSGPNGTGKSIILRMIAMLWDAAGYWLDQRKIMPKSEPACNWLNKWGGCAVVFNEIFDSSGPAGLFFGDSNWFKKIKEKSSSVTWIGEAVYNTGKLERPSHKFLNTFDEYDIDKWAELRKKLILTFGEGITPNLIYMDAEERRWIPPKRGVGKPIPEDSKLRWLVRYKTTEDWQGQLEASLITLKTSNLHFFHEIVRELNKFLYAKEIETSIQTGKNRLRVKLKNGRGKFHFLDDLSSGEHQVLIGLYLLHRWLEPGGIVLIDEPDLHLHPSLIPGFLASLEFIIEQKKGQLLLTSHLPDIWKRYESTGRRIPLRGEL